MLTGFHTVKTGNKWNVKVFRRFNRKPLMYVFPWKVTNPLLDVLLCSITENFYSFVF